MNYCRITVIGRVGQPPETRAVGQNTVCNFSVAYNEKKDTPVQWYRVAAWNKLGVNCQTYVTKGMPVLVSGRLRMSEYKSREGEKRTALEIDASEVTFLGGGEGNERSSGHAKHREERATPQNEGPSSEASDDEIPF